MQYPRICLCAMLACLFSCFRTVMGQETIDLKSLADSVRKANGKPNFLPLGMHFLELAKERKDTANISDAYAILANHYYELGDTDSLRLVTYEYMDWADRSLSGMEAVHPANDRKGVAGRGDEGDGFTLQRRRETER